MSLWIVDYKNTNIGSYKELIIVFVVKRKGQNINFNCKNSHCIVPLLSSKLA